MSGQSGHQIVIRRHLPFCDPHSAHVDRVSVCESQYFEAYVILILPMMMIVIFLGGSL